MSFAEIFTQHDLTLFNWSFNNACWVQISADAILGCFFLVFFCIKCTTVYNWKAPKIMNCYALKTVMAFHKDPKPCKHTPELAVPAMTITLCLSTIFTLRIGTDRHEQTEESQIRRRILRRLIWVYPVCHPSSIFKPWHQMLWLDLLMF